MGESKDQSLDIEEKQDDDEGDTEEATKDTADELVEETTSETLDAVNSDDAKEPISIINEANGKPNYLKSSKENDDNKGGQTEQPTESKIDRCQSKPYGISYEKQKGCT